MQMTWKKGALIAVLIILIGYIVSVWWSVAPEVLSHQELKSETGSEVVGYATTTSLILTMEKLLDKSGGWLSNDVMPPSVFMDNMPAFEFGALEQARDLALIMRKEFSRSQSQSAADKDLLAAHSKLNIEHTSWLVPSAEGEYSDAIKLLKDKIPEIQLMVYGDGEYVPELLKIIEKLKLNEVIKYYGLISLDKIAEIIPECDIGIIPNRLGPFTQINFPTRIFEYLHMKKPVVVPRTQGINDYFNEEAIFYFDAGNAENLANVIFNIYSDRAKAVEVVNKGYEIYQKHRWESQSKNLINIYEELLN